MRLKRLQSLNSHDVICDHGGVGGNDLSGLGLRERLNVPLCEEKLGASLKFLPHVLKLALTPLLEPLGLDLLRNTKKLKGSHGGARWVP